MNVLAFDTCFDSCSVAAGRDLGTGTALIEAFFENRETGHAERLMPLVELALKHAGLAARDLDRIAVTVGPGSFTGTRTGVAAARGLRLVLPVSVVATTSLAVMAEEAADQGGRGADQAILAAVDARRGGIYAQLFGRGGLDPRSDPLLCTTEEAANLGEGEPLLTVGSAAAAVAAAALLSGRATRIGAAGHKPDAVTLLYMALRLVPLETAPVPLYLRPADAKPQSGSAVARA